MTFLMLLVGCAAPDLLGEWEGHCTVTDEPYLIEFFLLEDGAMDGRGWVCSDCTGLPGDPAGPVFAVTGEQWLMQLDLTLSFGGGAEENITAMARDDDTIEGTCTRSGDDGDFTLTRAYSAL